MTQDEATSVKIARFPDQLREVRGGDSMVVKTDRTPFATLVRRGSDGVCQRPQPADSTFWRPGRCSHAFASVRTTALPTETSSAARPFSKVSSAIASRLHPKRRKRRAARACSATEVPWCCPTVRASTPFTSSTAKTLSAAARSEDGKARSTTWSAAWWLAVGSHLRQQSHGSTMRLRRKTHRWRSWLNREFELFSMLPLTSTTNQCILTGQTEEEYPLNGSEQLSCSGFCRFPGDHTEIQGVRRIHHEHALGNMVLRVPRRLVNTDLPYDDRVKITDNTGRSSTTLATTRSCGRFRPKAMRSCSLSSVATSRLPSMRRPHSAMRQGLLAQGLRAAVSGLDGIVSHR